MLRIEQIYLLLKILPGRALSGGFPRVLTKLEQVHDHDYHSCIWLRDDYTTDSFKQS